MHDHQMSVTETWYWALCEAVCVSGDPFKADELAAASIDEWRAFINRRAEMARRAK
jgi:hypothetical protein